MDDMDAEGYTKTRPIDLIDNLTNLNDVCHVKISCSRLLKILNRE